MPNGQRPKTRVIYKEPEQTNWTELMVAWQLSDSENCSVTINVAKINEVANGAETIRALMVPNKPRTTQPANANRPAPQRRARGAGPQAA